MRFEGEKLITVSRMEELAVGAFGDNRCIFLTALYVHNVVVLCESGVRKTHFHGSWEGKMIITFLFSTSLEEKLVRSWLWSWTEKGEKNYNSILMVKTLFCRHSAIFDKSIHTPLGASAFQSNYLRSSSRDSRKNPSTKTRHQLQSLFAPLWTSKCHQIQFLCSW